MRTVGRSAAAVDSLVETQEAKENEFPKKRKKKKKKKYGKLKARKIEI